jgi:small subunit ribosomal protein S23
MYVRHSAILYAVNLHEHHDMALNQAYSSAVAQFRALRSEHEMASKIALREAEHYGIEFGQNEVLRVFAMEEHNLNSWKRTAELNTAENLARKRWRAVVEPTEPRQEKQWTRGQEYTRLWQEGVRPTYSPALASALPPSAAASGAPSAGGQRPAPGSPAPNNEARQQRRAKSRQSRRDRAEQERVQEADFRSAMGGTLPPPGGIMGSFGQR